MGSCFNEMVCRSFRAWSWLLFLGLIACQQPRPGAEGGHLRPSSTAAPTAIRVPDAGAGTPTSVEAAASVDVPAAPLEAISREDLLRAQVRALTELLDGQLPTELTPESIFEVNLLDAEARSERIDILTRQLRRRVLPDAGMLERPVDASIDRAIDAGPPTDASVDASIERPRPMDAGVHDIAAPPSEDTVLTDERLTDAGLSDAGPTSEADPAAEAVEGRISESAQSSESGAATAPDTLSALERERDRLRLAFLLLPTDQQTRVLDAVRARRQIAIEEQASEARAARAAQDARRASEASDELFNRAASSADASQAALLAERARIEATRADLARWEMRFAGRRQSEARTRAGRLQSLHGFETSLQAFDSQDANRLYDEVVSQLVDERRHLHGALDELDTPTGVPAFSLGIDLLSPRYRDLEATRDLGRAVEGLTGELGQATHEEERLRWQWADGVAEDLRQLDAVRVTLLPRLSKVRQASVLGLGSEGRDQLAREIDQIGTLARWWTREIRHDAGRYPLSFLGVVMNPNMRLELAWATLLAILGMWTWRRRQPFTLRLRQIVQDPESKHRWAPLVRPLWTVMGPVAIPLLLVFILHLLVAVLESLTDSLFFDVLGIVVLRVTWFYVLVTLATSFFVSRLRRGTSGASPAGRAKTARGILSSVRLVLGFGLVVVLITDLSELFVGRGYIYSVVVDLSWLGAIPITLILIRRWKDEVCEAHRIRWVEGFVARALSRADKPSRRYFLTPFAATHLAISEAWDGFKGLALHFEQLRRAFAFLFRRRLERRVESVLGDPHAHALTADLRAALSETPADAELAIEHFPKLDGILDQVRDSLDSERAGFMFALVGERGIGKTTWLRELERRVEGEVSFLDVPRGLTDPGNLCRWLSKHLDLPITDSPDKLARALDALEQPRVVILDHCQNMVVRTIGGMDSLEAFVELASRARSNVVWLCSFSHYTWRYLEFVRQGQSLFRQHLILLPWTDAQIADLIDHRMQACGKAASFQDLLVDPVAGSALEEAIKRTEEEYLRLLWDFASGNPRIALHFWKHSLAEVDDDLRVRLFAAPDVEQLESLHEQSRFLLATIALHENATLKEAALSSGTSRRECSALLVYLRSCGYVEVDEGGHWRLSTHWYRGVIRHLGRQRLLSD